MIWIYILGGLLAVFLLAVKLYKRRLINWRDNADFTTVQGQALIKACNRKLDFLNGYGTIKRYPKRGDTK